MSRPGPAGRRGPTVDTSQPTPKPLDAGSNTLTLAQQFAVLYAGMAPTHTRVQVLGPDRVVIFTDSDAGVYGEPGAGPQAGPDAVPTEMPNPWLSKVP